MLQIHYLNRQFFGNFLQIDFVHFLDLKNDNHSQFLLSPILVVDFRRKMSKTQKFDKIRENFDSQHFD